jgi:hypothetical protein
VKAYRAARNTKGDKSYTNKGGTCLTNRTPIRGRRGVLRAGGFLKATNATPIKRPRGSWGIVEGTMDEKTQKKRIGRPFEPGNPGGPGRPKGMKNTVTDLRNGFMEALDRAGGVAYLTSQARKHPGAFMSALSKMLPRVRKVDTTFKPQWPDLPESQAGKAREAETLLANRLTSTPKGGNRRKKNPGNGPDFLLD